MLQTPSQHHHTVSNTHSKKFPGYMSLRQLVRGFRKSTERSRLTKPTGCQVSGKTTCQQTSSRGDEAVMCLIPGNPFRNQMIISIWFPGLQGLCSMVLRLDHFHSVLVIFLRREGTHHLPFQSSHPR